MQLLGLYWLLSTVITFFVNFKKRNIHDFKILLDDKYFTFFTFTFSITFLLYFWNSFSFLFIYLFYFLSIFISLTFSPKNEKYVSLFLKFHWSATFTGTMIAITSGNGLQAFSQGCIVFIPFLVLILVENINISKPFLARSTLIFSIFTVLVSALWALRHPYRDQRIPNLQHELDENIFSGLNVSRTKKEAISWLNENLHNCGIEDGKSALVIGGHPWIYFASKLEPSTPVTFMHFRAKSGAFEIIAEEISSSPAPEVIILAEQPPPNIADSVQNLLKKNVYKTYEMIPPLDLQKNLYNEIHYQLESPLIIHRLIK
jgi:hypothetical protein